MKRAYGLRLLFGVALVFGTGIWLIWDSKPAAGGPPVVGLPPHFPPHIGKYLGTASCASMACHNANGLKGHKGSEYSTWVGHDKHANAYAVLKNARSQQMVKNLYGNAAQSATETALCLKCHSTNDGQTQQASHRFQVSDGVGCEACHGPAGGWIADHYKNEWQTLTVNQKLARGFNDTKNFDVRTKMCASCHVGDGSKEVNHDLIAAGHPRLNFELGAYLGIYHKHWPDESRRHQDFQARIWRIGQIGTAKAAIELLQARAKRAIDPESDAVWPEFGEYECFACHQDLNVKDNETLKKRYENRRPGAYRWQTWYLTMLRQLAEIDGKDLAALNELQKRMEVASPQPKKVSQQAAKVVAQLDTWQRSLGKHEGWTKAQLRAEAKQFLDWGQKQAKGLSWDQSSQLYLGLAAYHHALSDLGDDVVKANKVKPELLKLQKKLQDAFPEGYDSPSGFTSQGLEPLLDSIRRAFGN